MMKTIVGNNEPGDVQAIQQAIDQGFDRIELQGRFDFGLGDDRKTLFISRPVTIVGVSSRYVMEDSDPEDPGRAGQPGKPVFREGPAIIRGGGLSLGPEGHMGVFVVDCASGPVEIIGVHFEHSRLASIVVTRCYDVDVRNCHFRDGHLGWSSGFTNMNGEVVKSVSAVLAWGAGCEGRFRATGNVCSFRGAAGPEGMPDDEQFIAIFGTRFHSIRILGNSMTTRDDGIEVLRNGYDAPGSFPCEISIKDNAITIEQRVGVPTDTVGPWHAGIVCCLNGQLGTGAIAQLEGNTIAAHGPYISAFALSGDHFVVSDNEVFLDVEGEPPQDLNHLPSAAFLLGVDVLPSDLLGHLGASLKQSDIFHNTIAGKAQHAICAWENPATTSATNDSAGSVVEDNDFSAFTADDSVFPDSLFETNWFAGNLGLEPPPSGKRANLHQRIMRARRSPARRRSTR